VKLEMSTPLERVLGARTAKPMADSLDLHTVRDLLRHYPRRFATRGERVDLAEVQVGDRVTVLGKVLSVQSRPMRTRKGTLTEVVVGDGEGGGRMKLVFFNHKHGKLAVGVWGLFAGTVGSYKGEKQFAHPDMHLLDSADDETDWARALVPIYPATKDVSSWVIQRSLRTILGEGHLGELVVDPIP
jgi:ATP-dependent DNA helicase RecG